MPANKGRCSRIEEATSFRRKREGVFPRRGVTRPDIALDAPFIDAVASDIRPMEGEVRIYLTSNVASGSAMSLGHSCSKQGRRLREGEKENTAAPRQDGR